MAAAEASERGRQAFERMAWQEAHDVLSAAVAEGPLSPDDLERLAMTAHLLGREAECDDLLTRAHYEFLRAELPQRAVRVAVWLAFHLLTNGDRAQAAGWIARAARLLDDCPAECAERGLLLLPVALRGFFAGDPEGALRVFMEATAIGERVGDIDLVTMGRHGQGRALLRLGRTQEGLVLLDEVMVSLTGGEVMPVMIGDIYCSVIEACHEVFDLRRAQEWTAALNRWCASQPDLIAYRGSCLVHRAQVMQFHGEWSDAMAEARHACERLSQRAGHFSGGSAYYQLAELHRLRGEFAEAEAVYREAGERGRKPQPGLALLRLAQGEVEAARQAICHAVEETTEPRLRAGILGVCVDIMLASNELESARTAAAELTSIAEAFDAPYLRAVARQATGSVLLAAGDARGARQALQASREEWRELGAPYEAARVGVMIGLAARALGDAESGQMELDGARRVFEELGARPDLERLRDLGVGQAPAASGGLTGREVQVLRLIATGRTNRAIATALGISERTIARHVSNIFTKLGLSSRAAATAYAYQQRLVSPRT